MVLSGNRFQFTPYILLQNNLFQRFYQLFLSINQLLKSSMAREFRPSGAPEVKGMTVDRIKYDSTAAKGSFRVLLDISYAFGVRIS